MQREGAGPLQVSGVGYSTFLEWRPVVFLQPPHESSMCAVCRVVMGAMSSGRRHSCGHVLCRHCVIQLLEDGVHGCPFEHDALTTAVLGSSPEAKWEKRGAVLNALRTNGLKVYCINARHGCQFVGRLDRLADHLRESCEHSEVPCPVCGRVLPHKNVWQHRIMSCLPSPGVVNGVDAAATPAEAAGLKTIVQEYLQRARAVRGKLSLFLQRSDAAINGLQSNRLNGSSKTPLAMEVLTHGSAPAIRELIECSLLVEIPSSPWYGNPEARSASKPAVNPEARASSYVIQPVVKDNVLEYEMCIDWPEEDDKPEVVEAVEQDMATLCGFRFKLNHFRAELGVTSWYHGTKFVVFELLVQPPGDVVHESGGGGWRFRREVKLTIKHPCGPEGDLELQTFNCGALVGEDGGNDRWVKKAVTAPVQWAVVREFVLCGQIEVAMLMV